MHRGTDKVGELEAALVGGGAWTSSRGARIAHARAAVTAVHRHAAMRLTLTMDTHVLQYCWRLRVRSEARGGSASHPAGDERRVTAVGVGEAKRVLPASASGSPARRGASRVLPRATASPARAVRGSRVARGGPSPERRERRAVCTSSLPPLPLAS